MVQILNKINGVDDLKKLSLEEMNILADEIRQTLIEKISTTGGHMGSNLGIIEMTIALHYVFNSPKDKFVFDVSHQTYTHKILTGRKETYTNPETYDIYTGYSNPDESEHDLFTIGHTSTAISLATGLATARDLKKEKENIVAIVGDGSMSGGEAFEGLNNASMLKSNMIIIFNDNEMSIAKNYGGMYQNFEKLRETNGEYENNFFKTFGLEYIYLEEGNNIEKLIELFSKVKDTTKPILLHIRTLKGKGLDWAVENKEAGHWTMPASFDRVEYDKKERYDSLTVKYFLEKMEKDPTIMVITAATPGGLGLTQDFRDKAGNQFIDVGIAEEHAVAFASGLAKNGAKPILTLRSSFSQRVYDQLSQDLALNKNPATILIYGGTISSADNTHLGVFDMSMMSNIPNIICLAPATKKEYLEVLDWSVEQNKYPVIIRMPIKIDTSEEVREFKEENLKKYQVTKKGSRVAILALGSFYPLGKEVLTLLEKEKGIKATLVNPLIYSEVDEETLNDLKLEHNLVITLEDGILNGGFGEKIASFYGNSKVNVLNFGAKKEFTNKESVESIYERNRLTKESIVADIIKYID